MEPTYEQIQQLKKLFFEKLQKEGAPCQGGFHPTDIERIKTADIWVQRFLEQHDLDMSLALDMLWKTCEWRKNYGTNELTVDKLNMDYVNAGLGFARNRDVDGKVLYILKSNLHFKGLRDNVLLLRGFIYLLERLYREENYDKITLFFDLAGAGLSNLDIEYTKSLINIVKDYYPNALNYILIYDLPWILNAAFKIIKALLPPKAVEVMRFVNSKNLHEFVNEANQLTCWGGKDDYVFVFEPEKPHNIDYNGNEINNNNNLNITGEESSHHKKKVHFANNSGDSTMTLDSSENLSNEKSDSMLRMNPSEAIIFQLNGNETIGTVDITNVDSKTITYKVKTTSPDKYRVRPSTGILSPGASVCINVVLQHGHNASSLNRDKFLVMCMVINPDSYKNPQDITELWKITPSNSAAVEQHRLKCTLPMSANGNGIDLKRNYLDSDTMIDGGTGTYGNSSGGGGGIGNHGTDRQMVHFSTTVNQLHDTIHRIESQLKLTRKLQWITLFIIMLMSAAMVYILKNDMNTIGSSCLKRD